MITDTFNCCQFLSEREAQGIPVNHLVDTEIGNLTRQLKLIAIERKDRLYDTGYYASRVRELMKRLDELTQRGF